MASDDGSRRAVLSPCAFTGSEDLGTILPNTERTEGLSCPQEFQMRGGMKLQGPGSGRHYSGGGRRLRSFISSSPFQYLKLLSRCCINSGRSTKAGGRDRAVSSFPATEVVGPFEEREGQRGLSSCCIPTPGSLRSTLLWPSGCPPAIAQGADHSEKGVNLFLCVCGGGVRKGVSPLCSQP